MKVFSVTTDQRQSSDNERRYSYKELLWFKLRSVRRTYLKVEDYSIFCNTGDEGLNVSVFDFYKLFLFLFLLETVAKVESDPRFMFKEEYNYFIWCR